MEYKGRLSWRLRVDINSVDNLFSHHNIKLPYEVTLYSCSCREEYIYISSGDSEDLDYECPRCANRNFYDANYYSSNYAWYDPIEKMPFYENLYESIYIEEKYNEETNSLLFSCNIELPKSIELSRNRGVFDTITLYSLSIDADGNIQEELLVKYDLDALVDSEIYYFDYPSQNELINRHELLTDLKKDILQLALKHPITKKVALVKYECSNVEELAFFIKHPHLKQHGFLAWQEDALESLPKSKALFIKDALSYILSHRKEKSLIKAVYANYEAQIKRGLKYSFAYIHCVCKYISDPNIASKMVGFKVENENEYERFSFAGVEKLFEYLIKNYSQKQIEQLIEGFSKNNIYLFFDLLEMFLAFDEEMLVNIEKIKPRFDIFHDAIAHHHRLLVHHKLLEISFAYSSDEQNACKKVEQYTIRLPQNGLELYKWSSMLQNCLSGYAEWILSKKSTVYGFFRDEKLEIAVEVSNNSIIQASSKYNAKLSSEDTYLINGWFREYLFKEKKKEK